METIRFWQSKTFWLGVITIAIGVFEAIRAELLNGGVLTILGVLIIILRIITTSEIALPEKLDKALVSTGLKVEQVTIKEPEITEIKARRERKKTI